MPTTRQKFLQALGIASASLGLRPAAGAAASPQVAPPSNSRLHVRAAGLYQVSGRVEWATAAPPSVHTLALRLRDQTLAVSTVAPWWGSPNEQTVTALTFLEDEDVRALELVAYGNSGGPLSLATPAVSTVRVA